MRIPYVLFTGEPGSVLGLLEKKMWSYIKLWSMTNNVTLKEKWKDCKEIGKELVHELKLF